MKFLCTQSHLSVGTSTVLIRVKIFILFPPYPVPALKGLNQDLENGWPKLAIIEFLGNLFLKGEYNIQR